MVYAGWCTSTFPSKRKTILNRRYVERWIGRGRLVPWPPRSEDLYPLDFCVWGYAKGLVYNTADTAISEELQYRIVRAFRK